MKLSLEIWLANGWVVKQEPSRQEISDLLGVADRDLQSCAVPGLSSDWKLAIAYNAVIALGTAALAAEGYRASRDSRHYRVVQSLELTLRLPARDLTRLDYFRKKRNISDYDRAHAVSDVEAGELMRIAVELRKKAEDWLRKNHPDLM